MSFVLAVKATGQSNRRLSVDLALMKAIGLHQKRQLVIDTFTPSEDLPFTSRISKLIRTIYHYPSEQGVKQGRARMLVESILRSAMEESESDDVDTMMSSDSISNVLDFAECGNPPDLYNCSASTINQFRTADGTCNNLDNPLWGASSTTYSRMQPAHYEDGIQQPVGFTQQRGFRLKAFRAPWPSAREVSRIIVKDLPLRAPLSHLFVVWGQVIAHDLGRIGEFDTPVCDESCDIDELSEFCFPILVNPRDADYGLLGQNRGRCLPLSRAVGECIRPQGNHTFNMARQQLNQVTHYLDGSGVYGSTARELASLRLFEAGLMKVGGRQESIKENPPFGPIPSPQGLPLFAFGDFRGNIHTPLMPLQTILLRQHNHLARQLAIINPCWDDERLYQEARKIVGAIIQIISYEEFLPLLYGSHLQNYIGSYPGYDSSVMGAVSNEYNNAAFRFGHSLISDSFARLDSDNNPLPIGPLGLREAFVNSFQYFISGGTDPLLRGLMQDTSRASDVFINRVFTTQLFAASDDSLGQDIASLDIQRGRENGLAPYRTYEKLCRDKFNVNARFMNDSIATQLKSVYGDDGFENGIDLFVGSLAEEHLEGANVGPTLACIMGMSFSSIRDGDRFWWQNPGVFTASQRASLGTLRLSKLICDHADNIPMIKRSVFLPGGQPVSCNSLPSLDLSLWKDNTC